MLRWLHHFHAQRSTTTLALKMACRLASVPVLTVSMLKRLQDLGDIIFSTFHGLDKTRVKNLTSTLLCVVVIMICLLIVIMFED
jgi:hypothetical protein